MGQHWFEIKTADRIEVTLDELAVVRSFVPGMTHYYVDGEEVSRAEYLSIWVADRDAAQDEVRRRYPL